jgi:transposase
MTKYSKELRVKVVTNIEAGNSINGASLKYGVSRKTALRWYRNYKSGGIEQLISAPQKYSMEFKLQALVYKEENSLSYLQAASDLRIPNEATLYQWGKIYTEQGLDGLQDTRKGRPPKMPKKKDEKRKTLTREQELEAEIAKLQMENAYLKKLNALVHKREKSKKETK